MASIFKDIFVEFLEIAFHFILFQSKIYPDEIFENRKKYGTSVKYSLHPQVNGYITDCLLSAKDILSSDSLDSVVFCILDSEKNEIRRFVFNVFDIKEKIHDKDHYLIKCEQNLRAFFLKLSNSISFKTPLPDDSTFTVMLHTNESAAVKLGKNPNLEHFPFIEHDAEESLIENEYFITPIHTLDIDIAKIQIYLEHQENF